MTIDLAGRVAIVTGAGRGLGRQYAIALAARGARVVVNDVGGALEGGQPDASLAQSVVHEITAAGGNAVASIDSVASQRGARAIAQQAIDTFGTIDILVNNAGITIRKPFDQLSHSDFSDVYETHVLGTFNCCKEVWGTMQEKGRGRIVVTTSMSGMYGMYDQVNYSTAKAGLIGFTRALSLDGRKHGILVNAISPMAMTRMSEASQRPTFSALMTTDWPAALVTYFCSDTLAVTGQVLNAGMGYYARTAMVEGQGIVVPDEACTPEDVAENWARIADLSNAEEYDSAVDFIERAIPAILKRRFDH